MRFVLGMILWGLGANAGAAAVKDVTSASTRLLGHAPEVSDLTGLEWRMEGTTRSEPWSGSFWPDILGGIANHYRDRTKTWAQVRFGLRYDVARKGLIRDHENVANGWERFNRDELNQKLSPAEKYDLLLGNRDFRFTRAILDELEFRARHLRKSKLRDGGEGAEEDPLLTPRVADDESSYATVDRSVEYRYWKVRRDSLSYWFGICDGWAPASIHLPRPVRPVTVRGESGREITFYPDDLKALGSYLFSRSNTDSFSTMNYRFSGRPCPDRGAPRSERSGRVRDFRCQDVDAGLFHLILVNRIGQDRTGFMMDVDNNHKINNHPVGAYRSTWFHPATGREGTLRDSIVDLDRSLDPDWLLRHPQARHLVGVRTRVTYRHYHWPEDRRLYETDSALEDRIREVDYEYELEVDASGKVVGGEWRSREQPDFIWMADRNATPWSEQSVYALPRLSNGDWAWDGKSAVPDDWIRAAREDASWSPPVVGILGRGPRNRSPVFPESARNSLLRPAQPLSHLVYYLFDQSSMR
jgi:hypothetical protein